MYLERMDMGADDCAFFGRLAEAVVANPFGDRRRAIDEQLAGGGLIAPRSAVVDALVDEVERRLSKSKTSGAGHLERMASEDRRRLQMAVLFVLFHRYANEFDALIALQNDSPTVNIKVPFAPRLLKELLSWGFSETDACEHVGVLWQTRRAFFFIDRSLVGDSSSMQRLRESLWNNVFTHDLSQYVAVMRPNMEDFSTLLLGETGVGKGAAAAAIGRSGFIPFDRKTSRFTSRFTSNLVDINLAQFPVTLLESELFGHRAGAFTGAIDAHEGVFERCNAHGAIFIDEIGEIDEHVQVKLLKVLQERRFSPVGSRTTKEFRGRVIAATNRPLNELRQGLRFRSDLFFRLSTDIIPVPPLRERFADQPQELEQLVDHIVARTLGGAAAELAANITDQLRRAGAVAYAWPGNVRELEQRVRQTILTGEVTALQAMPSATDNLLAATDNGTLTAEQLLARYCSRLYEQLNNYQAVARRAGLDRRTVKRYVEM